MEQEARLIILEELAKEHNNAISAERMRIHLLSRLLINKPREWVEIQFDFLESVDAVRLVQADKVKIAQLTERGELHLSRTINLPGIMRPDRG